LTVTVTVCGRSVTKVSDFGLRVMPSSVPFPNGKDDPRPAASACAAAALATDSHELFDGICRETVAVEAVWPGLAEMGTMLEVVPLPEHAAKSGKIKNAANESRFISILSACKKLIRSGSDEPFRM
jgi:hypothetical protein